MEFLDSAKIIWGYLKKYKRTVLVTSFLAIIFAIGEGIIPYIYGRLVDIVSDGSFSFLIFSLLGIWVLTTFVTSFFKRTVSLKGEFIAADIVGDSVFEITSRLINLPLTFHREKKVGETVSRITRAADALENIIGDILFWVAPHFLTVVFGITIMFFINWQLAMGVIIIFVLSSFASISKAPLLMKRQKLLNKKYDKAAGILNDSFLNIQTIKSAGAEDFQKSKIKNIYRSEITPAIKILTTAWENTHFLQEILFSLGFVLVFGYAVFLLGEEKISQGVLVMFLGYLNLARMPLRFLLWQWLSLQRGMTAIKRAKEFWKIKTENYNKNGKIIEKIKGRIDYKNIDFSYEEEKNILKKINFSVLPGQKVALVGGSGEGKTTIVDLLSLYFIPNKGKILIDGVNISELRLDFLRSVIAYVPQEIILFNDTIKNNILYGKPDATEEEIIKAAKAANIHRFIESLSKKYNTLVGERGIKLSTGQKQRLAIARAIIRNPKILILDEATSSLDVKSEKMVQEALDNLIKGKTTLVIAHRLSTIREADKILVIEQGQIVEEGNHKALMKKKNLYYKLYSLQFKN